MDPDVPKINKKNVFQTQNDGRFVFPEQIEARECDNEFGLITRKGSAVYALSLSEVERLCAENHKSFKEKSGVQASFEKSLKYASKFKKITSYETSEACRNMLQQRAAGLRSGRLQDGRLAAAEARKLIQNLCSRASPSAKVMLKGFDQVTVDSPAEFRPFLARETGMMLNLMPYSSDEAKSLIPTLERLDDELIEESIKSLVQYKEGDNVV